MVNNVTNHLVGVHYNSNKDKEPSGFKLLELPSGRIIEFVSYSTVKNLLIQSIISGNAYKIEGIRIDEKDGSLVPSNGNFDRYPKYVNKRLVAKPSIVILTTVGNEGYEIFCPDMKIRTLRNNDALAMCKNYGIANGKVVNIDGNEFISSIFGTYPLSQKTNQLTAQTDNKKSTNNGKVDATNQNRQNIQRKQLKEAKQNVKRSLSARNNEIKNETDDVEAIKEKYNAMKNNSVPRISGRLTNTSLLPKKVKCTVNVNKNNSVFGKEEHVITVDELLSAAVLSLKRPCPFYYAALQTIPRIPSDELPTAGVTVNKLYFNPLFISKLTIPETEFLLLHEISHIAMKHNVRRGNRQHKLWNIACDLFINKVLSNEYMIKPKEYLDEHPNDRDLGYSEEQQLPEIDTKIRFLSGGLYIDSIDVKVDVPEKIYSEIEKEYQKAKQNQQGQPSENQGGQPGQNGQSGQSGQYGQGQQSGQNSQGNQQNGQSQQSAGQQQVGQNSQSGQQAQGQQGQGQQGQGQGQQGQGQGQQGQGQQGQGQGQQGQGQGQQGQGQGQQGQGQQGQGQQGQGQQGQSVNGGQGQQGDTPGVIDINYRGMDIRFDERGSACAVDGNGNPIEDRDLIEDAESANKTDKQLADDADSIIRKIATYKKQMSKGGNCCGSQAGMFGVVEAYVNEELIPKINWKKYVRHKLVEKSTYEKSLSSPDRRFIHAGVYIEGDYKDESALEGLKMCIDTSGSMSDEDIATAILEVKDICKRFKCGCEILYWDTFVESKQDISDYKNGSELKKYADYAAGRGGTSPLCIFEELSKREYRNGKKEAPSIVMIFTDGYFSFTEEFNKYKTRFKDTVWILISSESVKFSDFKPPFGKVAKFKDY